MDPIQALKDADQYVSDIDTAPATEALLNYYIWRNAGGFNSGVQRDTAWYSGRFSDTDKIAADISRRLLDVLNAAAESR